jgi:hypothetical protein
MTNSRCLLIARLLIGAAVLAGLAGCLSKPPPQVLVIGDLTDDGKKLTPPDVTHPVYYFPVVVGYREMGRVIAGEPVPDKNTVLHTLAVALAKRHYLVVNNQHPPDQLLVFWWGSLNPMIEDFGSNDPSQQVFFNEREMLALIGAYKTQMMAPWQEQEFRHHARDDRYYIILMAFDFEAARHHIKKPLWMAKMSTESRGTDLPAVIPALVASGAPTFGRDTQPEEINSGDAQKEENVTLGPMEVREYIPPAKK